MTIRVAINGYWRIWRNFHRLALLHPEYWIEVVAINSRSSNAKMRAHLLRYDSLHWKLDADIQIDWQNMITNWIKVKNLSTKEISELPWKELNIDVVLECTGQAKNWDVALKHIEIWAKKVLVSAPMKDNTKTIVIWVNDELLSADDKILSNASCTTNCIAPPLKIINEKLWIQFCYVNSIHSFTSSQNLLDNSSDDIRRARSAVQSVIPTSSWAMSAIWKVIPALDWKVDWLAVRVPIATSSVSECVIHFEKPTNKDELNEIIRKAGSEMKWWKILWVCDEELVSIDFKTDPRSCILDSTLTKVSKDWHHAQIMLWYDNEWGYANRLLDLMKAWSEK